MTKLLCIKTVNDFIKGKIYEVVDENKKEYALKSEKYGSAYFTKEPDHNGKSYKNWFEEFKEDVIDGEIF